MFSAACVGVVIAALATASSALASITFATATSWPAGDRPAAVVIVDLNGDGQNDRAAANVGSGDVSVLLGSGDGSFTADEPSRRPRIRRDYGRRLRRRRRL